jgi:hypothetical protein
MLIWRWCGCDGEEGGGEASQMAELEDSELNFEKVKKAVLRKTGISNH